MSAAEEIIDILQLINSENLGPVTFYKMLDKYGSPRAAVENIPALRRVKLFPRERAIAVVDEAGRKGIQMLTFSDKAYPQNLRGLPDAPPLLFVRGNPEYLNNPLSLSVVGARNASIIGRKTASRIAYDLSNAGVMIVSGMARGIDSAAHKGAMYADNQKGATVAVLGTGADVPYPEENRPLYEQIAEQGCIVSEFLPGTLPQANNFPRRNRIVAALTQGTLVVEATLKSGSLITARMADEHGRHLFAVPGSPADARSQGPNQLIKEGAHLAEAAADIIKVLHNSPAPLPKRQQPLLQKELDFAQTAFNLMPPPETGTKIIDYLTADGVYVDEIIRASGHTPAEVALELLELEMNGQIERQSGNKVALIKRK